MVRKRSLALLALSSALLAGAGPGEPPTVTLAGRIDGGSGRHPVVVALWREQDFLSTPAAVTRIPAGPDQRFTFEVDRGRWALGAFEDVNENGRLDLGRLGPREPSGMWRPFRAWRYPRFEDVAAHVQRDTADAHIRLR
ncbi:MAG TPA: DUF2141 domain-containing protein [Anaeromyxobacter sp.]|nr:DUF2141 domain-containing protein [Anaeromyxobacter sp.]